jgi:hypothetical protein
LGSYNTLFFWFFSFLFLPLASLIFFTSPSSSLSPISPRLLASSQDGTKSQILIYQLAHMRSASWSWPQWFLELLAK